MPTVRCLCGFGRATLPFFVLTCQLTFDFAQGYMAAHPEMMTNQKPDVLVVRFEADMDMATAGAFSRLARLLSVFFS